MCGSNVTPADSPVMVFFDRTSPVRMSSLMTACALTAPVDVFEVRARARVVVVLREHLRRSFGQRGLAAGAVGVGVRPTAGKHSQGKREEGEELEKSCATHDSLISTHRTTPFGGRNGPGLFS